MAEFDKKKYLRAIPAVDETLKTPDIQLLLRRFPRTLVVKAIQLLLAQRRTRVLTATEETHIDEETAGKITANAIEKKVREITQPSLTRVINASGIIVHTNLGRAPLSQEAIDSMVHTAQYYSNLEFDLEKGTRGSRYVHVERFLKDITGAEAGYVVNNNAAAVLLSLNTLARDREVIISRGELIEIGGSFRIPEIMQQSGARLVEVGTTNRTHISDYRNAVTDQTAAILKVHTSNYRVVGFTSEASLAELTALSDEFTVPVLFDMGSGSFLPAASVGLADEPTALDLIKGGADLVMFSGDKLLGGPQAGVIIGRKKLIDAVAGNPLARALRIDKLTLAALEATLRTYILKPECPDALPVIRMLTVQEADLKKRAVKIRRDVKRLIPSLGVSVQQDAAQVGGGSYPIHDLPTWVVAIDPSPLTATEFEQRLRTGSPHIISRISKDTILLDMRTVFPEEVSVIAGCLRNVMTGAGGQDTIGH